MEQTPLRDYFNADLLALVPVDATRVVEVGCGSGAMAREYRKRNPACQYVGIEIDPVYADASRFYCDEVLVGSIESLSDEVFKTLFPSSCWIFGDVLEHLYDPWGTLKRVRRSLGDSGCVVACIPNAQHWSVQGLLSVGDFRYQDAGLLDRTHIRWFTRKTIIDLFSSSGFEIEEMGGRVFDEPGRAQALPAIRSLAQACGADPDEAERDAMPIQYLVRARVRGG